MPEEKPQIPQRVLAIMQGQPLQTQFIIGAIGINMPEAELGVLLDTIAPQGGVDFETPVAGRPIRRWMGLSLRQIHEQCGGNEDATNEVVSALQSRNLEVPGVLPSEESAPATTGTPKTGVVSDDGTEPVYGSQAIPLSQLAPLTDSEILAKDGITEADLAAIRSHA